MQNELFDELEYKPLYRGYKEIFEEIFGEGFPYVNLRTLLDPYSSDWGETTMEDKLDMIKQIVESEKISILDILQDYPFDNQEHCEDEEYIHFATEKGLRILLKAMLNQNLHLI